MNYNSISARQSIPADTQTPDHAQPPQVRTERMQPPRNGALPYTREDYRALPDEERSAVLDFMIEGIIPDTNGADSQLQRAKRDMEKIVSWCIEHGEECALEFLYRQSGASDMTIAGISLDRRAVTQILPILKAYPQVKLNLRSVVIHEDAPRFLPN